MFFVLLSFAESVATKYVSFNNEPWMATSTLFDFKPPELNYSPFMISLDKSSESFNAVNVLSMKTCVSCETKDVNFKVFNMTTGKMKLKHW